MVTVIALCLLVLAGCSHGDDGGGSSPSPTASTASATATPTPTPTDVPPPAAARAHSDAGAKAFLVYYFERLNAAFSDPATQAPSPRYLTSCKSCASFDESLRRLRSQQQHVVPRPFSVRYLQPTPNTSRSTAVLQGVLTKAQTQTLASAGSPVKTEVAERAIVEFRVRWTSTGWSLAGMQQEQS